MLKNSICDILKDTICEMLKDSICDILKGTICETQKDSICAGAFIVPKYAAGWGRRPGDIFEPRPSQIRLLREKIEPEIEYIWNAHYQPPEQRLVGMV